MNPSRSEDYRLDTIDLELMCGPLEPSAGELHDWRAEREDRALDHCPATTRGGTRCITGGRQTRRSSFLDNGVWSLAGPPPSPLARDRTPTYPTRTEA